MALIKQELLDFRVAEGLAVGIHSCLPEADASRA